MKTMTDDERLRMANALDNLMDRLEQHSVKLQTGPDGKLIIPEKLTT